MSISNTTARRRLLALEVTIRVRSHSKQDAENIKLLAQISGLTGAASRSGIGGRVRMLSLSVLNDESVTPAPTPQALAGSVNPGPVLLPSLTPANVGEVTGVPTALPTIEKESTKAAQEASTSIGVVVAITSALGSVSTLIIGSWAWKRYKSRKAEKAKVESFQSYRHLLNLSRGRQQEEKSSNAPSTDQVSLQTVTCSLEYGDSFDSLDSNSEQNVRSIYTSGSSDKGSECADSSLNLWASADESAEWSRG